MTTQVRKAVAVGLLVAGLGLAGCGSDEKTIKTPDGTVKVDRDGDGVTVESEDGTFTAGKGLPDGFPEDDVPIIDGKVLGGGKGNGQEYAWSVILQAEGDAAEVMAEVKDELEDAGFTAGESMAMGSAQTAQFTSDEYEVGVTAAASDGEVTVTYLVRDVASAN